MQWIRHAGAGLNMSEYPEVQLLMNLSVTCKTCILLLQEDFNVHCLMEMNEEIAKIWKRGIFFFWQLSVQKYVQRIGESGSAHIGCSERNYPPLYLPQSLKVRTLI